MKIANILILLLFVCIAVNALQVIDVAGKSHEYDNAVLHKLETQELKTSREKDGVVRLNNWQGFRCDLWLKEQNLGDYGVIRFESGDRYQVSFSRDEFEKLESYLVVSQDGTAFENHALRLIIPELREMQWIRDLQRIVLEDFTPMQRPQRFYLLEQFLTKYQLHQDPKPFVKIEGWFLFELLADLSANPEKQVIIYSRDGLKQNLSYPFQLDGAVLEKAEQGIMNLKSPQIPGGMWVKDVVFLQCDSQALISAANLSKLIELSKIFSWNSGPELSFRIVRAGGEEVIPFSDALAEPQIFEGALYFELF